MSRYKYGGYVFAEDFNQDISNWDVSSVRTWDLCLEGTNLMEIYLVGMYLM